MLQSPYYEQLQTALLGEKRGYIYQHSASAAGGWVIGPTLGGEDYKLQAASPAPGPLSVGAWRCRIGGNWKEDRQVAVAARAELPRATSVLISGTEGAQHEAAHSLGLYTPTQLFSAGRPVFKHQTQELYLLGSG